MQEGIHYFKQHSTFSENLKDARLVDISNSNNVISNDMTTEEKTAEHMIDPVVDKSQIKVEDPVEVSTPEIKMEDEKASTGMGSIVSGGGFEILPEPEPEEPKVDVQVIGTENVAGTPQDMTATPVFQQFESAPVAQPQVAQVAGPEVVSIPNDTNA